MTWLGHNCCFCHKPDTDEDEEQFIPLSGDDWACPECVEIELDVPVKPPATT